MEQHRPSPRRRPPSTRSPSSALGTGARVLGALALAALAGAGCDDATDGPPVGGTAVVAYAAAPAAANPFIGTDGYSQDLSRFLLFIPLLRFDEGMALAPGLALRWEEEEGDTAAVFHLHPRVTWSDGRSTTAEDVAFTIRRALEPATGYPNRDQIQHIRGVDVLDSATVRLRFDPVRQPLAWLPQLPVLPRHVLDTVPAEELRSTPFNLAPVTNGPFRVVEARPGERWILEADSTFPDELGGRPRLHRLVWRAVPESTSLLAELRAGDVDIAVGVGAEEFDRMKESPGLRGIERPQLNYSGIAWNGRRPPLDDVRVRQALGHAIDRTALLDGLRRGHGSVLGGPVPPGHRAYSETAEPPTHDPERARSLLAEAGYTDRDGDGLVESSTGDPLRIVLLLPAGNDGNRAIGQVVQSHLRAVGVQLELRPLEWATLGQVITGADRDFDAVLLGLNTDPRLTLRGLFHSEEMEGPMQVAGYGNPAVDSLLDEVEMADGARIERLWAEIQRIIAEDQPWAFLYAPTELSLVRERLKGVEAGPFGPLESAPDWWIEPEDGAAGS